MAIDNHKLFRNWFGVAKKTGDYGHSLIDHFVSHDEKAPPPKPKQVFLLQLIAENEGSTQKELAALNGTGTAAISSMLSRLEKNGSIERRADGNDRRCFKIYLTEQQRKINRQIQDSFYEISENVFYGFSDEEKEQFNTLLAKMNDNLDNIKQQNYRGKESSNEKSN